MEGRNLDPREGRNLRAEIQRLSTALGVRDTILSRIARLLGERLPNLSFDEMVSRLRQLAETASGLQRQITDMEAQLGRLQDSSIRSPALAAVARAETALEAGDLDAADAALAELEWLRRVDMEEGMEVWLSSVQARADLAVLRLDPEAPRVVAQARQRYEAQTRRYTLRLANMEASAGYWIAVYLSDRRALDEAIQTWRTVSLPLAGQISPQDLFLVRNNLADAVRLRFTFDNAAASLDEARGLFEANLAANGGWNNGAAQRSTTMLLAHTELDIASYHLWSGAPGGEQRAAAALERAITTFEAVTPTTTQPTDDVVYRDARVGLGDALTLRGELNRSGEDLQRAFDTFSEVLRPLGDGLTNRNFSTFAMVNVSVSTVLNLAGAFSQNPETCRISQNNARQVLLAIDQAENDGVAFRRMDRQRARLEYAEAIICQARLTSDDPGLAEARQAIDQATSDSATDNARLTSHAARLRTALDELQ